MSEELTCLDNRGADHMQPECEGPVELRMPLSSTGKPFPRCDHHWKIRVELQEGIDARYPIHQPSDFDPTYAGERWEED